MAEIDLDDWDVAAGLDWWEISTAYTGMPPLSASALIALAGVVQRAGREAPAGGWVSLNEPTPVVSLAALALTDALHTYATRNGRVDQHNQSDALRTAAPHAAADLLTDHDSARRIAALRPPATGDASAPTGRWLRTRGEDTVGTVRPDDAAVLDMVLAGKDDLALGPNGTHIYRGDAALTWLRGRALRILAQLASWVEADPLLTAPHVWQTINEHRLRLGWYDCPDLPPLCGPDEDPAVGVEPER